MFKIMDNHESEDFVCFYLSLELVDLIDQLNVEVCKILLRLLCTVYVFDRRMMV